MKDHKVLKEAVNYFGDMPQIDMFIEEASELITKLMHYRRGRLEIHSHEILEEIADVKITLAQIEIIFDNIAIPTIVALKIDRLEKRILKLKSNDTK